LLLDLIYSTSKQANRFTAELSVFKVVGTIGPVKQAFLLFFSRFWIYRRVRPELAERSSSKNLFIPKRITGRYSTRVIADTFPFSPSPLTINKLPHFPIPSLAPVLFAGPVYLRHPKNVAHELFARGIITSTFEFNTFQTANHWFKKCTSHMQAYIETQSTIFFQ
jgi:hypothetical protein